MRSDPFLDNIQLNNWIKPLPEGLEYLFVSLCEESMGCQLKIFLDIWWSYRDFPAIFFELNFNCLLLVKNHSEVETIVLELFSRRFKKIFILFCLFFRNNLEQILVVNILTVKHFYKDRRKRHSNQISVEQRISNIFTPHLHIL